jgi:serine/threonine protein kinase
MHWFCILCSLCHSNVFLCYRYRQFTFSIWVFYIRKGICKVSILSRFFLFEWICFSKCIDKRYFFICRRRWGWFCPLIQYNTSYALIISIKCYFGGIFIIKTISFFCCRPKKTLDDTLSDSPKDAVDLVKRLLHFNPDKRITAEEGLRHPYVQR